MEPNKKPVLSIGMIFKNEIRCLERCMKALQPLRDAIPCELVMADTGSDDGSREIAEQYADIFFDFPWIDDFAAARNAVMDRCSGEWFLSIDCDEWFDEDISDLVNFLANKRRRQFETGAVVVRNYTDKAHLDYGDLVGVRLKRMDTGCRYQGRIHEALPMKDGEVVFRSRTILHHDGYVVDGGPGGKAKGDRNMPLLEKMLEEKPGNLRLLLECVESARTLEERERYLRQGIEGVEEKRTGWDVFGPGLYRYEVAFAKEKEGETARHEALVARMTELFPNSPYTTIDAACTMVQLYSDTKQYDKVIPYAKQYLRSLAKYNSGDEEMQKATLFGTLTLASAMKERYVTFLLASAYYEEFCYEEAIDTLQLLKADQLNGDLTRNYVGLLMNLHSFGRQDLSGHMARFWDGITAPGAEEALVTARKNAVATVAGDCFQKRWREKEDEEGRVHAYTLFLSLEGKCETGLAAAVIDTEDPAVLTEKLLTVENWNKLSIHALCHALECGVLFPLPGKKLPLEELDKLANRMGTTGNVSALALEGLKRMDTPDGLCWVRGLFLSAMQEEAKRLLQTKSILNSTSGLGEMCEDAEQIAETMALVRGFTEMEGKFLSAYYAPGMLTEETIFLLPPLHRFGWYCTQAFEALDGGDLAGYVRALRAGLTSCESMKPVVEFLTDHTPELQQPSQELLELAEKVWTLLSAYDPTDPAVAALKQSPAYQKVAHLIEGAEVPVVGGLVQ